MLQNLKATYILPVFLIPNYRIYKFFMFLDFNILHYTFLSFIFYINPNNTFTYMLFTSLQ